MCNIIATEIRGKNTPLYKNNRVNEGNTCIIVNAGDPLLTGKKLLFKVFRYHTGFIGHLREIPYREVFRRKPELMVRMLLNTVSFRNQEIYAEELTEQKLHEKCTYFQRTNA